MLTAFVYIAYVYVAAKLFSKNIYFMGLDNVFLILYNTLRSSK